MTTLPKRLLRPMLLGLGGGALLLGCSGPGGFRPAPAAPSAASAPTTAAAPAPRDPAAAAGLLRTDREFASASVTRGTPAAFADYSAEGVTNLPANGPTTATRQGLLARLANMGDTVLTWEPQRAEVTDSGEMGFTWGEWALRQGGATGAVRARGKYLNVWRRQADGAWKAVVDIANTASASSNAGRDAAPLQVTAPATSSPAAASTATPATPATRPRAKRRPPRAPD